MFGFLKKFGKKSEPAPPRIPVAASPIAPVPAAPVDTQTYINPAPPVKPAGARTTLPSTPSKVVSAPAALGRVSHAPAPAFETVPACAAVPSVLIDIPLKKIWSKLHPDVTSGATGHPNGSSFLSLPLTLLHAQLAKGSVRIPFAQIRQYSSEGLFSTDPQRDSIEVDLPIGEILPLLKPEHLVRNPNQRRIDVPDEIGPIFGPNGGPVHGLRVADQKSRPPGSPATPAKAAPQTLSYTIPVETTIPAPAIPAFSARATPAPAPVLPVPASVPSYEPALSLAVHAPEPVALRNDPIPAPRLDPSLASLKPKPVEAKATPANAPDAPAMGGGGAIGTLKPKTNGTAGGTFKLALMDIAAFWSENGKNELSNLYRHTVEIPMSTLESALKAGKLIFQWREVRPWLRLNAGNSMPSLNDDLEIEFPLSMIAPRFMEQRGLIKPKNRQEATGDIPNVFAQKSPPPSPTASIGAPVLGATAVSMEIADTLAPPSGKTGDTAFLTRTKGKKVLEFGEIFGQPEKKDWTLAEIAEKTLSLRGVAGAVIGSSDGLLMAGKWPNGVKGDAVAAFLPQMFNRMLNYSKELKLGDPTSFTITIESVPLQIFKAGNSYFSIVGRAGENLPKAQLNAVATRLGMTLSGK